MERCEANHCILHLMLHVRSQTAMLTVADSVFESNAESGKNSRLKKIPPCTRKVPSLYENTKNLHVEVLSTLGDNMCVSCILSCYDVRKTQSIDGVYVNLEMRSAQLNSEVTKEGNTHYILKLAAFPPPPAQLDSNKERISQSRSINVALHRGRDSAIYTSSGRDFFLARFDQEAKLRHILLC